MKDNKYKYQIVSVLNPKIEEKEKEEVLVKIEGWVDDAKAKVVSKNHLGMIDMVYKIRDFGKGDFWVLDVEGEKPIQFKEFNLFLNREPKIIRYLILKK
ncbi:MAG: 30S ribosomal protein S6 [Candidatus Shapirobacteria bacterium]|jgi:ribosomal protein S6